MIISLNSLKGGGGKSTVATNLSVQLAIYSAKVALIDCDQRNKSSFKFLQRRPDEKPKIFSVKAFDAYELESRIELFKDKKCDFIIIDGTPTFQKLTSLILSKSDLCLFPIRPSSYDIESFDEEFYPVFKQIAEQLPELQSFILRNAFRKKTLASRAASRFLEDYELPVLNTILHNYTIYESAPIEGIGVSETANMEARFEMQKLAKEVNQILTTKTD